jgi:hypothetical protein
VKFSFVLGCFAVGRLALQAQGTLIDRQAGPDGTYGELPFELMSGADRSFTPSLSAGIHCRVDLFTKKSRQGWPTLPDLRSVEFLLIFSHWTADVQVAMAG